MTPNTIALIAFLAVFAVVYVFGHIWLAVDRMDREERKAAQRRERLGLRSYVGRR